jgi:hypothetical protein
LWHWCNFVWMLWIGTSKFKMIFTSLKFQNLYNLVNVFFFLLKTFVYVFLIFFQIWWVLKNEGVTFLVVPPNYTYTRVAKLSINRKKKRKTLMNCPSKGLLNVFCKKGSFLTTQKSIVHFSPTLSRNKLHIWIGYFTLY